MARRNSEDFVHNSDCSQVAYVFYFLLHYFFNRFTFPLLGVKCYHEFHKFFFCLIPACGNDIVFLCAIFWQSGSIWRMILRLQVRIVKLAATVFYDYAYGSEAKKQDFGTQYLKCFGGSAVN